MDGDFKPWLMISTTGDKYSNCRSSKTDYIVGISAVKKHADSDKHKSITNLLPVT